MDLALDNLQRLIYHKIQPTNQSFYMELISIVVLLLKSSTSSNLIIEKNIQQRKNEKVAQIYV